METSTPILALDTAVLRDPVRQALGSATAKVETWEARPLGNVANPVTVGVYRIRGTATDSGAQVAWSVVLKVYRDPGLSATANPRTFDYGKREFLAYSSGLLSDLPQGVRAPRFYGAEERPEGGHWLWLEDLTDIYGTRWPLERYGLAARHAGLLNGAYLAKRPLPAVRWLCTGIARSYVERWGSHLDRLPEFINHSLVQREWPVAGTADRIVRLWHERETFLTALARLPRTLNHLDFFKLNLFAVNDADGQDATVAVDWSFLGIASIGEELSPLVFASAIHAGNYADRVRELGELTFERYLEGLRETGWKGDPRLARLGYAAGTIRFGVVSLGLLAAIEPKFASWMERAWGPFGNILDRSAAVRPYMLDLADEARDLMQKV